MAEPFKVGVTSDLLGSRGQPVCGPEPLRALDAASGLRWEWLPQGIREITAEHAAAFDALYINSPRVPAAAVAGVFGNAMLTVIYFVVLPPFAWAAKRAQRRDAPGFIAVEQRPASPRAQY